MANVSCNNIIAIFVIVFVAAFLYRGTDFFDSYGPMTRKLHSENEIVPEKYPYQGVSQDSVNQQQADIAKTYEKPEILAYNARKIFPDDLLPQSKETTEWSRSNPPGKGSLELKNMLAAGQHIGVNTQGSSMRNANQQIRSEYPNPIIPVSIFNNSSITPDIFRKELEIGESL